MLDSKVPASRRALHKPGKSWFTRTLWTGGTRLTLCRPSRAVNARSPSPTVQTVGYGVTSLRDFEQHVSRKQRMHSGRNLLRGSHFGMKVRLYGRLRLVCVNSSLASSGRTLMYGPAASHVSEVDLLSRVFRGRVEYIAYDNRRARPAIVNVPGFVNLPAFRGQLKRSAHFPAVRSFFVGDE